MLVDHYANSGEFTGGSFESYGTNYPSTITADDLVAVSMLSIEIRLNSRSGITPVHAIALERRADEISELLSKVPHDIDLHTLDEDGYASILDQGGPAWSLYDLLRDKDVISLPNVATHKLLARKRPRLLPVFDSVIKRTLNPTGAWDTWWTALNTRPELVARLDEIRIEANASQLSLLRTADVAVWMQEGRR